MTSRDIEKRPVLGNGFQAYLQLALSFSLLTMKFSLVALTLASSAAASTCSVADADKRDCGSYASDQASCEASGCCWSPAGEGSSTPWCFHAEGDATTVDAAAL